MVLTNEERILNLLGLAFKAKKIITGEENVVFGLQSNKCKIVFVANDASSKTIDKFEKKCFFYNVDFNNKFSTDELTKSVGKTLVKVMALTDQGFYDSLVKLFKWGVFYES